MTIYSNILAWRIPWTGEPGGLQSMESQRVRSNFHFTSSRVHCYPYPHLLCHGYSFYTSTVPVCLAIFDCLYLKVKHWTGCLGVLHQWQGLKTGHILPEALRQEWNRKSIKYSFFFFFWRHLISDLREMVRAFHADVAGQIVYILNCPKRLFRFFCNIMWKNLKLTFWPTQHLYLMFPNPKPFCNSAKQLRVLVYVSLSSKSILEQKAAHSFYKGSSSKYFRLCGPGGLCHSCWSQSSWNEYGYAPIKLYLQIQAQQALLPATALEYTFQSHKTSVIMSLSTVHILKFPWAVLVYKGPSLSQWFLSCSLHCCGFIHFKVFVNIYFIEV